MALFPSRNRIRTWAGVLLLVLGCAAAPSGAAGASLTVTGRVELPSDSVSEPIPPALRSQIRVQLLPAWAEYYRGRVDLGLLKPPEPVQTVVPEPDGTFELTAPAPGVWTVRVEAPGFVAVERGLRPLLETLEVAPVTLSPDAGMEVQVVDPDGHPLARIWVGVLPSQAGWEVWREAREARWMPARRLLVTDAEGRVHVPRAPGEELLVRAARPGGPLSVEIPAQGGLVVVRLDPGRERELFVRDLQGRPVPDVAIRLGAWRWPAGFTDAEGRAELSLPAEETTAVWLSTEAGWKIQIPVAPPEARDLEGEHEPLPLHVTLPDPVTVSGAVTDASSGEPLAEALVWAGSDPRELVFTDPRGRYILEAAPAQRVVVSAARPRFRGFRQSSTVIDGRVRGLAFQLRPLLDLHGVVLDPDLKPVAGAKVRSRIQLRADPAWDGRGVYDASTGPDGRFRIDRQPSSVGMPVRLRIEAEGFPPHETTVDPQQMENSLEIVLSRGVSLAGEVVDPNGQPLPGARVALFLVREGTVLQGPGGEDYEVFAGHDGRFLADHLPEGRFVVEVRHPGHTPAVVRGVDTLPPEDLGESNAGGQASRTVDLGTLVLEPGVDIAGRIVGPVGEPVPDARIRTRRSRYRQLESLVGPPPGGDPEGVSGTDGSFRLQDLRAGDTVILEVEAERYVDTVVQGVTAPTEEPLEVVLERGGRVFGRVRDGLGRPVPRAWVQVTPMAPEERSGVIRFGNESTRTDRRGVFDFPAVPTGKLTLEVRARGFVPWRRLDLEMPGWDPSSEDPDSAGVETILAEPAAGEAPGLGSLEVTLDRGLVLEGRVTDARGGPAVGAEVRWRPEPEQVEEQTFYNASETTRADAEGWYRFDAVAPSPGRLSASLGPTRAEVTLEPSASAHRVDLQLEAEPGISGRVVDDRGRPIEEAQVTARSLGFQSAWHSAMSRSDGTFDLALEPGEYVLHASKPGWADVQHSDRLRVADRPLEGIELRLRKGARIVGQIEGLSGTELGRLRVFAQPVAPQRSTVPGEVRFSGSYRIGGISPGRWEIFGRLGDGGRTAGGVVDVTSPTEEVRLDLEFEPAVQLTGIVRRNGEPQEGLRVSLDRRSRPAPGTTGLSGGLTEGLTAETDASGRFHFPALDPGTYLLAVAHGQGWAQAQELDLQTDRDVALDSLTTRIVGRLVGAQGEPVMGGRVHLVARSAGERGIHTHGRESSDAEGRFVLEALPEGPYRVTVSTESHGPKSFPVQVVGTEMDLGDIALEQGAGFALAPRLAPQGTAGSPGSPRGDVPSRVHVLLYDLDGTNPVLVREATVEAGVATFAEAPAGSWKLVVAARGALPVVRPLDIPEGGRAEPVPVVLERAAELLLRVPELQREGGEAWAVVRDASGQPFRGLPVPGFQIPDGRWPLHNGKIRLSPLPAGSWSVEIEAADGRVWSTQAQLVSGSSEERVLE